MDYLGRHATSEARVYFASGTSIVYWGLREKSIDVDLKVEGQGLGTVIREAKNELNINIEPEHPGNFIPLPPSWRERSPFIKRIGTVQFFHMDPYSVTISKLARGTRKDLDDVRQLIESNKTSVTELRDLFFDEAYQEELDEMFSLDPESIGKKIVELHEEYEGE